ncbi:MAG: amidohydrolase family protein [Desulfobulbaceae bacterium]|nr:amidohydrolase family protein [Desulfobulbaceae bacterium]
MTVRAVDLHRPVLYRAPFVVPVTRPLIEDGGVLVDAGRIIQVDSFRRMRQETSQVVELEAQIIVPALINCHVHLELSYLADLGSQALFPKGDITAWIRALLVERGQPAPPEEIIRLGRAALAALYRRGVGLVCDVGNGAVSQTIADDSEAECLFFQEMLAVTEKAAQSVLAGIPAGLQCTAHAPYSCHGSLLVELKSAARQSGRIFPIHVAESADEIEFLQGGTGPFQHFLTERLQQVGALVDGQELSDLVSIPGCGAVEYLSRLQLLDSQTICVHAVHVSEAEADMLASTQAKVCLCPGSNRVLGVGKVNVWQFIKRHILPGLGTDSLTSNICLDLWHEMQVLQEDHPDLLPELIFAMATQGGAETLGVTHRLGALAPGLEAKMLAVDYRGSIDDIYPFLVNRGREITVSWLEAGSVS